MTDLLPTNDSSTPAEVEHLRRLHDRLSDRAGADHLLDATYRTVDTPIGRLLLAATELGLVRVAFEIEGFDAVVERLATTLGSRLLEAPASATDEAARELDEYFSGSRREFQVPLDRRLSHGFRRDVHEQLSRIPFGTSLSYGQVAADVGNPKAVRAVGTACATNPIPIIVPCHRVLRSDGSVGQYLGGTPTKHFLLSHESSEGLLPLV